MVRIKSFLILLGLVLLDQITKIAVNLTKPYIDLKILAINFVQNTGAVWGVFQDSNTMFIWISVIAVGFLVYSYDKVSEKAFPFYILLFAGIVGNLIDRLFLGYVVDFIDFRIWPVFNLADSYIVIGVLGMIYFLLKEKGQNSSKSSNLFR